MNYFFTADTHFFHKNVIDYCSRPFDDMYEMNSVMVKNWNSVVGKNDVVYHLGDFAITGSNRRLLEDVILSLNGNIHLVIGSHEKCALKFKHRFASVKDTMQITIEKQMLFGFHYCCKTWPRSHYGSWHIHGHSHGGLNDYAAGEGKIYDVGVDINNFTPISYDQIIEIMKTRPLNFNDLKRRKH